MKKMPKLFVLLSVLLALSVQQLEAQTKPVRVFILAGQSNMEGHAKIETFDYIGDDPVDMLAFRKAMTAPAAMPEFRGNVVAVETAPFWSDELGSIDEKRGRIRQMRYFLDSQHKDYPNADGLMTEEQKNEYLRRYEAELISPAEVALWQRGASNAGYHYLGCAKTFARMGQAFAEANLRMLAE